MATHIAKGSSAEIQTFAPVARMIITFTDEGPFLSYPQPYIPVELFRHWIRCVWLGIEIAPFLIAPGMDLLDFANHAVLNQFYTESVFQRGMNLDSHLGDDPSFRGPAG